MTPDATETPKLPAAGRPARRRCLSCLALAALVALPAAAGDLIVSAYPAAAYRNEHVTFLFASAGNGELAATLEGRELGRLALAPGDNELTLALPAGGRLAFTGGATALVFQVVTPRDAVPLSVRQGHLVAADGLPAILLVEHRIPPPLDRTWETVRVLRGVVQDQRPVVRRLTLLGAGWLPEAERKGLASLPEPFAGFWEPAAPPAGFSELDGLITALPALKTAPDVCLALAGSDLEHGLPLLTFRLKLEWYLQALRQREVTRLFLVTPALPERVARRHPEVADHLRLAAEANSARFVNAYFERLAAPPEARALVAAVLPRVQELVRPERLPEEARPE